MADRAGAHVARFNDAVASGDWTEFVATFADDSLLEFVNVPAGSYSGRAAIATAYRDSPPDDTIVVRGVRSAGTVDDVDFAWTRGGDGLLHLEWTDDSRIARMVIEFR